MDMAADTIRSSILRYGGGVCLVSSAWFAIKWFPVILVTDRCGDCCV